MKKKWIAATAIIAIIAVCLVGFNLLKPKPVSGAKTITVTLVNEVEDKQIYSQELKTDAETLGQLLDEVKDLKAVTETSAYGRLLTSLLDIKQGDMATGPWWLYESENNESCKAAGFCPAIDDTMIQDKDNFTFKYTDTY